MIKINLLNAYKEAAGSGGVSDRNVMSDDEGKKALYLNVAKKLLVLAVGPIGFYMYEAQTKPVLNARLSVLNQKHSETKEFNEKKHGLAEEIKQYQVTQARFNAQMDFINKIDRDKVNEYKLFEHLKTSIPDNVWINKLDLFDNSLVISAESDDPKEFEKFIQRLAKSDFITNVIPMSQFNKKSFAGTDVATTVYTVKAKLVSPGAQ